MVLDTIRREPAVVGPLVDFEVLVDGGRNPDERR
jgi:hypothetical protein